ncbi:DUF2177 family protein [Thermodesulfobacteriota bacterium]
MGIPFYIKLYALTIPVFFVMDILWLGVVAKGFYNNHLANFLSPNVKWGVAVLFYLIYIAGILIFAVVPALQRDSLGRALLMGGLFGFFTYATYDLTNMATLKDWPGVVVVVDIIWGVFLCTVVSGFGFYMGKWLG